VKPDMAVPDMHSRPRPDLPSAPEGRLRVLYLGGIGRSGSTLLERMLGELPGTCSLGEVVHLWDRGVRHDQRCGCGAAFSACPFWQAVGQRAFGGWQNVDVERHLELRTRVDDVRRTPRLLFGAFGRSFRRDLEEYAEAYQAVYEAAREISGARLVIDSSKVTSLAYCLRRLPDLDLRLLHLIRDSRAVAYSWTKMVRRPEVVNREAYMHRFTPKQLAFLWSLHNTLLELPRMAGTPTRTLRYEQFARDPETVLRQVAEFAGLPLGPDDLGFLEPGVVHLNMSHQVAGNPMRFTTGQVKIRKDEAWRTELAPRDRRQVAALTAPVSLAFGYSPFGTGR
jgi:Sulfotransferase family